VQWSGPSPAQDPANFQTINYKHDVYGRRIEKKVDGFSTRYLYDGDQVIAEYDGNNNLLRKYIYGPGIDQPVCMIEEAESETYYYHFDALGSVVALSDSSGDTVQTYQYTVYGEVWASDIDFPNPYMFAGRRYDIEIGLYYNRARYYNPFIGRFLQIDPVGYKVGMNLYAYCGNSPLNFVDPSGLRRITEEEWKKLSDYAKKLMLNTYLDANDPNYVSDVEAMARIADEVAKYTGGEPNDVKDFIDVFSRLLCAHIYGRGDGNILPHKGNHDQVRGFRDTGFNDKYKEDANNPQSRNQVSHFVAFLQAGYYGGYGVGTAYAVYHEGGHINSGDFRLGERGSWVGDQLKAWEMGPLRDERGRPTLHTGMDPNSVGNWIRTNLATLGYSGAW
jgi:RHS repeat-associated protein